MKNSIDKYQFLLSTLAKNHWRRIGIKRRAGVIVPLFSIYSQDSFGIGDILDLKKLIDWCKLCGFSLLQFLPLNDTGFNFYPFSPQSFFALDPMYLSLKKFGTKIDKKFRNSLYVDYNIKGEKLRIFWEIFSKSEWNNKKFEKFKNENIFWLKNYCLYRALKQNFQEKSWEEWPEKFKYLDKKNIMIFQKKHFREIEFQAWLQWQMFEQFEEVKNYAQENKVFLIGDLPWLAPFDSADVWANSELFDLRYSAGAPPDAFSKKGQEWGAPLIKWEKVFKDNFLYFKERLKFAQNFYDLFRIDHVLGIFRIWKVERNNLSKNKGLNGFFDPSDENLWEEQGRKILKEFIKSTKMLPIAEDLGTIPACCPKVLNELGILGMKVQRWAKHYPLNSIATLSTHDTSNWPVWFKKTYGRFPTKIEIENNLKEVNSVDSIFSTNLIFEWLFLDEKIKNYQAYRINTPGTASKRNWRIRLPMSLEELLNWPKNQKIKEIIKKTNRLTMTMTMTN